MSTIDAGAVEATLTLDRSPFTKGIKLAREQAKRFEDMGIKAVVYLDTQRAARNLENLQTEMQRLDAMSEEDRQFWIDTDRAERDLREIERREKEIEKAAKIQLKIDDAEAKKRLRDLEKDRKAEIKADLDAARAREQMAILTRNRRVALFVHVANMTRVRQQLQSVGKIAVSLSGWNVVQNRLLSIKDNLENLDKVAYRLGGLTYLFGNIANLSLVGVANITTLIGSLGALGGAFIPLPALIGSVSSAIGVLAIAFTGWNGDNVPKEMQAIKDVLTELTPAWNDLLTVVRSTFWSGLADDFSRLGNELLPILQRGLVSTAEAMNDWALNWGNALLAIKPEVWDNIFGGIASSIKIANGSIGPLVDAFSILGSVGSDNLDRLSSWFVTISERFDTFISTAAADGRLQQWIDNSAQAFGDLATVLGQLGGIFNGVTDAFRAAGTTTLGTLADYLTEIHSIVDSPAFQTGLTTIFTGMRAGAEALMGALGPIGDALGAMAPTIAYLAEQVGTVLGGALEAIAGAVATPAFQTGLTAFFDGIAAGIAGIEPFLPQIAAGIGAIGEVAGTILANVGPALGALLGGLADILVKIAPDMIRVANVLGGALLSAIEGLLPAIEPLIVTIADLIAQMAPIVAEIIPPLAEAITTIVNALIPIINEILPPLLDIIAELAPLIGDVLVLAAQMLAQILQQLAPLFPPIVDMITEIFSAIQPLIPAFLQVAQAMLPLVGQMLPTLMPILRVVITLIMDLFNAFAPLIPIVVQVVEIFAQLITAIMPLITAVLPAVTQLLEILAPIITWVADLLSSVLAGGFTALQRPIAIVSEKVDSFTAVVSAMVGNVKQQIDNLTQTFSRIKDTVTGAFANAKNWLSDAARRIIDGFIDGITGAFDRIRRTFNNLTKLIPDWKGPSDVDAKLLTPAGSSIMDSLIRGVDARMSRLRGTLRGVTDEFAAIGTDIPAPNLPNVAAGRSSAGINVQMTVHNPITEPTSVTAVREMTRLASLGVFAG